MVTLRPPGTGKTSIARAVAHNLGAPFFYAAGSDFKAHLHGLGAERIRSFFADVRREASNHPKQLAVAFIDEIDVIAAQRGTDPAQGCCEQLTELLTQIDGFNRNSNLHIIVIAATNRKDILDSAIVRAGRLEILIEIPLPNKEGRAGIIKHYLSKIKYKGTDILTMLVEQTEGMSDADLEKLINDAAILAGSKKAIAVTQQHVIDALAKNIKMKKYN